MKTVVLDIQRDKETGEYSIPWVESGKRNEDRTYYTDDLEDARHTLTAQIQWAQRNGYNVRIKGNKFIPDLFRGFE